MSKKSLWVSFFFLVFCVIGMGSAGSTDMMAQASTLEASTLEATTLQPVGDHISARDQQTFDQDLSLTNACVKSGQNKTECLCVTRVLKYELNLREYRIASQLYTHQSPDAHRVVKLSLIQQGYKDEEIDRLSRYSNKLTEASNFQMRCQEAQAYFTNGT